MEDTLKKLRELLIASYYLKHPNGPDISVDSQSLEDQRRKIISLERQVLETMSFDFRVQHPQPYIIKFTRALSLPVELGRRAWEVSIDSYKTLVHLRHTPHAIALGCMYIAASLLEIDVTQIKPKKFLVGEEEYYGVIFELLELYIDSLPHSILYDKYSNPGLFMAIRIEVNKRIANDSNENTSHRDDELKLRDYTLGDKGAIRFVLDWDRELVEREMSLK